MHLIQQRRNFLNFIDYHGPRPVVIDLFSQELRSFDKSSILFRFEQVNQKSIAIPAGKESALSRLPRTSKKKALRSVFRNIYCSFDIFK